MHEASAHIVGGTLTACDYVMQGKAKHAANLGGGLHHGFKGRASGFCIYNDSTVAIKYMQQKYNARVLYIDTDAHHGDGVQWSFYDDPDVCTISIHETGRYLFPGTGNVTEEELVRVMVLLSIYRLMLSQKMNHFWTSMKQPLEK